MKNRGIKLLFLGGLLVFGAVIQSMYQTQTSKYTPPAQPAFGAKGKEKEEEIKAHISLPVTFTKKKVTPSLEATEEKGKKQFFIEESKSVAIKTDAQNRAAMIKDLYDNQIRSSGFSNLFLYLILFEQNMEKAIQAINNIKQAQKIQANTQNPLPLWRAIMSRSREEARSSIAAAEDMLKSFERQVVSNINAVTGIIAGQSAISKYFVEPSLQAGRWTLAQIAARLKKYGWYTGRTFTFSTSNFDKIFNDFKLPKNRWKRVLYYLLEPKTQSSSYSSRFIVSFWNLKKELLTGLQEFAETISPNVLVKDFFEEPLKEKASLFKSVTNAMETTVLIMSWLAQAIAQFKAASQETDAERKEQRENIARDLVQATYMLLNNIGQRMTKFKIEPVKKIEKLSAGTSQGAKKEEEKVVSLKDHLADLKRQLQEVESAAHLEKRGWWFSK